MDRNPKDARQRYTKESLYSAFLTLLEEKAVSDIAVVEICDRAGVSRKTFYKYYSDQFALLMGMQDDLFEDYRDLIATEEPNIFKIAPQLIGWADKNRVLVKAIFANRGEGNFIDRMCDDLFSIYRESWEAANPTMAPQDVEALFYYVVSGLIGLVRHWLVDRPELTAEQVIGQAFALMRLSDPSR